MNLFKRIFKKKKSYSSDQKFELLIIDETSQDVTVTLGINPERKDEIFKIVIASYKESSDLCTAAQKMLRCMNHINEVTYALMMLHKVHAHNQGSNPLLDFLTKFSEE